MKAEGLSRVERLSRKRDFERVFRKGKRVDLPYLRIIYAENGLPWRRIGFAVSKKVGKAVVRNRIKRVLRETFRRHKDLFPPNCDLVFVPRREVASLSPEKIARDLENISWEKRGGLKSPSGFRGGRFCCRPGEIVRDGFDQNG